MRSSKGSQGVDILFDMFVADTKIIFGYTFGAFNVCTKFYSHIQLNLYARICLL